MAKILAGRKNKLKGLMQPAGLTLAMPVLYGQKYPMFPKYVWLFQHVGANVAAIVFFSFR
jgi:hypothetical protein